MFRIFFRQGSLLNPFIQAIPFALLIIFWVPDIFNKYEIKINRGNFSSEKYIEKFIDFDADGYSELIVLNNVKNVVAPIPIVAPLPTVNIYSQTNEPRYVIVLNHPWINKNNLFSADVNHNGKNEIFIFTRAQDTVFLESFEHYSNDSLISKSTPFEILTEPNSKYDFRMYQIGNTDLTGDGSEEFVFMFMDDLNQGPIRIYAWDVAQNSILKSPAIGMSVNATQHYLSDIDGDGMKEIILATLSNKNFYHSNKMPTSLPYPDTVSYLCVLDHDLTLLFEPVGVISKYLYTVPLKTDSGICIAALANIEKNGTTEQEIRLYNPDGQLLRKKTISTKLTNERDWIFSGNNEISDKFYLAHTSGLIECYNADLSLTANWKIEPLSGYPINPIDLNNDGENEFIFRLRSNTIYSNEFTITQDDLSHPLNINLGGTIDELSGISITKENNVNKNVSFLIQLSNDNIYLCSYTTNPTYKFKYFIWVIIYVILVVFIALMQWAQRIKTQRRIDTEKELAKFQLIAIKNQIDPHFTLNTLNTISSLYGKGENQEAYKYMTKLSRLMLLVLNNSDQISSTLKAEVEMLKNYIELQMIRFKDVFNYSINWDEIKLSDREVPRMLIHLFVENAIKHGLRLKKKDGFLKIDIRERGKYLYVIIEDNGVGRKEASHDKSLSSGKGLEISNKICQLYHKLKNVKVSFIIEDLINNNVVLGTKVTITVHPKLFKL